MERAANKKPSTVRRRWMIAGVWLVTAAAVTVAAVGPAVSGTTASAPASSHPATSSMPSVVTTSRPATIPTIPATAPVTPGPAAPPRPTGPIAPPPPGPLTRPDPVPLPRTEPAVAPTTQSTPVVTPPAAAPPPSQPEVIDDRVKYWMAYMKGKQLREALQQGGASPDDLNIIRGVLDGLQGHDPAYSRQEIEDQIARMLSMDAQKKAGQKYADDPSFRKLADENMKKSRDTIEQYAQMDGTETRGDGVLVRVLDPGNGRVMGNAKSITIKVRVELADGSLVKETDPSRTITISPADLLPALAEDCRGMKVGAHWRLLLPPEQAYGLAGKPPLVGPNQALIYDIQLTGAQ
jgi:FKBP-type peptidyl-prolyl cis-trans isomerase FklB